MSVFEEIIAGKELKHSMEYQGVYELFFESRSYGVTADADTCTVDVLLKLEDGKFLLTQSQIEAAIKESSSYTQAKKEIKTELGPNNEQVSTLELIYQSDETDSGAITLTYPLDNKNVFYMTLDYDYPSAYVVTNCPKDIYKEWKLIGESTKLDLQVKKGVTMIYNFSKEHKVNVKLPPFLDATNEFECSDNMIIIKKTIPAHFIIERLSINEVVLTEQESGKIYYFQ